MILRNSSQQCYAILDAKESGMISSDVCSVVVFLYDMSLKQTTKLVVSQDEIIPHHSPTRPHDMLSRSLGFAILLNNKNPAVTRWARFLT